MRNLKTELIAAIRTTIEPRDLAQIFVIMVELNSLSRNDLAVLLDDIIHGEWPVYVRRATHFSSLLIVMGNASVQ